MRVQVSLTSLALLALAANLAAQDSILAATAGPATTDSVVEAPKKKKKGFFGKMKDAAKNKTVQQVAKVAACTMVPGGQMVAGAIDAASSASDGDAAGTASGAAGAATGSSCLGTPGGAGMGGMSGAAGVANMAGTTAAMMAGSARFGDAAPGAAPGPGTDGGQFVMTEKEEKQYIKMLKKSGLTEEQAKQQVEIYKQQMSGTGTVTAPDDD